MASMIHFLNNPIVSLPVFSQIENILHDCVYAQVYLSLRAQVAQ
jgi:hypothetical protein